MVFCCYYSYLLTSGGTCFPSNCHNCLFGRQLQCDRPHPLPPLLIFCFDFLYIYRYFFVIIINVFFFLQVCRFYCILFAVACLQQCYTSQSPDLFQTLRFMCVCVCVLHMCGILFSAFLCSFFRVILLRLCSLFSYVRPITNGFWRVRHTFERVLQKTLNSPIRNCFKQWLWKSYFDEKIILCPFHIYVYIFIHMQQAWHILSWISAIYRQIALLGSCRLCNHNYYWF